jgi:hypothetical protein
MRYDDAQADLCRLGIRRVFGKEAMKIWVATSALIVALISIVTVPSPMLAQNSTAGVEGIVVPDTVHDRQPFSFAVTQAANQGEIDVSSVSGVVVQHATADKYGRVFLAAGLPAGAYLISLAVKNQGAKAVGKIEVQSSPAMMPAHQPMQLANPPQTFKLDQSSSLSGHGFDPNYSNMQVTLRSSGAPQTVPVLAATEDQLKLAPVSQVQPGPAKLTITNTTSGNTFGPQILLLYSMQGHLVKHKLTSGKDQTELVVDALPQDLPLQVRVDVSSGPVNFGGGRKQAEELTENGRATFPVYSESGSGPFHIDFALSSA